MTIIQRINALREQKRNLFTRAQGAADPDELTKIKDEMTSLSAQIADWEQIRDEMASGAEPEAPRADQPRSTVTLGDVLQQAAAHEFNARGMSIRGVKLNAATPSGQNVTAGTDGGYLLNPTFSRSLLDSVRENSYFLPRARRLVVGADSSSVVMPYLVDKDRKEGARFGGVRAYWMGEAEKYTASKVQFATKSIQLAKLGALGYATEEILRDSSYLESIMSDAFRNEMTWQVDEAALFGEGSVEGSAPKPTGILNTAAATGNKALVTVPKESGQSAASVVAKNIVAMWTRMTPANRARAEWLINPEIEEQLIFMLMQTGAVDTGDAVVSTGQPIYMPANGLSASPYATILGRPVVPNEHMAAPGALGDIAFIDPTEYYWIDRDGIREATSVHVRFEYDEMAFKFTYRCNGMPTWYAATTPPKGSVTRSPYVALAARA